MDYLILEAISTGGTEPADELAEMVNEKLAEGYVLQGGVCALHENFDTGGKYSGGPITTLMQAMIRN